MRLRQTRARGVVYQHPVLRLQYRGHGAQAVQHTRGARRAAAVEPPQFGVEGRPVIACEMSILRRQHHENLFNLGMRAQRANRMLQYWRARDFHILLGQIGAHAAAAACGRN